MGARRALIPSSLSNRLRVSLNWTNSSTAPQLRGISHSALHSMMSTNSARLSMDFHETPLRNELNLSCETLFVNSDKKLNLFSEDLIYFTVTRWLTRYILRVKI